MKGRLEYCFGSDSGSFFLKPCCFMRYYFGMGLGYPPCERIRYHVFGKIKTERRYVRVGNETLQVYEVWPTDKQTECKIDNTKIRFRKYTKLASLPKNQYQFITKDEYTKSQL
jgi:hypothetical protein